MEADARGSWINSYIWVDRVSKADPIPDLDVNEALSSIEAPKLMQAASQRWSSQSKATSKSDESVEAITPKKSGK